MGGAGSVLGCLENVDDVDNGGLIWGFVLLVEVDDGNRIENEFLVIERRTKNEKLNCEEKCYDIRNEA